MKSRRWLAPARPILISNLVPAFPGEYPLTKTGCIGNWIFRADPGQSNRRRFIPLLLRCNSSAIWALALICV